MLADSKWLNFEKNKLIMQAVWVIINDMWFVFALLMKYEKFHIWYYENQNKTDDAL